MVGEFHHPKRSTDCGFHTEAGSSLPTFGVDRILSFLPPVFPDNKPADALSQVRYTAFRKFARRADGIMLKDAQYPSFAPP